MPTGLRQAGRESYEGIALRGAFRLWAPTGRDRGGRSTAEGAAAGSGAALVVPVCGGAAASEAASSTDSGLMATEAGGLRTTGGPFGKRSGCAA